MQSTPSCSSRQNAVGIVRAAGKAAADADDGDRLFVGLAARGEAASTAAASVGQIAGERLDRRVFVDQRGRQFAPEPLLQVAGERDGRQGVEAIAIERGRDVDLVLRDVEPLGDLGDEPGDDGFGGFPLGRVACDARVGAGGGSASRATRLIAR